MSNCDEEWGPEHAASLPRVLDIGCGLSQKASRESETTWPRSQHREDPDPCRLRLPSDEASFFSSLGSP
jgi:hypothetical protein